MSVWPEAVADGFAIAAVAHRDAGAALAADGLTQTVRASATLVATRLAGLPAEERRAFLRARLRERPLADDGPTWSSAPARVRALLAHGVSDRARAQAWIDGAMPRAGYQADRQLLALLAVLARHARTPGSPAR